MMAQDSRRVGSIWVLASAIREPNLDDLDSNAETSFDFAVALTLQNTRFASISGSLHFSEATKTGAL